MSKKPKKFLSLHVSEEPSQLEQSIFSRINPEGLDFITHNIKVVKEGLWRSANDTKNKEFHPLTKEDIDQLDEVLGRGAAGQVKRGILRSSQKLVAIKSINIYDQEKRHQLMNDLSALLKHKVSSEEMTACPFLVKLYGAYYDEGCVKVVLELMDCGSLSDLIKKAKKAKPSEPIISEPYLARIAMQILNGLMYLHVIGHQIHRDIKPANILINRKGEVKLTDFGIMKELEATNQFVASQKGTVAYMSPETLKGEKINYLCDIWSFGLVMVELARGEYPYSVKRNMGIIEMLDIIAKDPLPVPDGGIYSDDFRSFIARCLERTPEKRASAIELLSHPWMLKNLYKKVDMEKWIKGIWDEPKPVPKMETINEDDELQKEEK